MTTLTTTSAVSASSAVTRPRVIFSALCAIALGVISFGVGVPELPESVTAQAARAYLTDNSAALRLFGISMAASAVLLVVLMAQLRALIAASEERRGYLRDVAFGAGILCAVWLLVSGSFHAATVFDGIEGLPDEIVLGYYGLMSVGDTLGSASTFAKGALMLAVGLAAVRTRFLPRWLGWLSVVLGAMALGGGLGVVENPVTGALWYAGLIGFALWPLLVGVTLLVNAFKRS